MNGELRRVDDVPDAFASLVIAEAPRRVALSGGGTARACYDRLAAARPDWQQVDVYYGDERWVPVDHPDSNARMARAALLDAIRPRSEHPMYRVGASVEAGAEAYDELLRAAGPADLVHLGLGPDGHTCSLFPGAPQLDETDRWVVSAGDAAHPHPRLTVTYPWLATARLVVFTVAGVDKQDALARIRSGDDLPAARVRAERVVWLVDPAALDT